MNRALDVGLTLLLCAGASAQQTLTVDPLAGFPNSVGLTFSNPGANFFDLVVSAASGITLHALEIPSQEPIGTVGTIELWVNVLAPTHVGAESLNAPPSASGDPSGWQLLAAGRYVSAGFAVPSRSCQSAFTINFPDTELAAGVYPLAIVYDGIAHQFFATTTWPAPAGAFADGNIEVRGGATQAWPWIVSTVASFTYGGVFYAGCIPDFGITYSVGSVPHICAESERIGEGSITHVASFWDRLSGASQVSASLAGKEFRLLNVGGGYVVSETTGLYGGVQTVAAPVTQLAAVDDGENQYTLQDPSFPTFVYPDASGGGATSASLWIHSNGYISLSGSNVATPIFFAPVDAQAAMDVDGFTLFPFYHDFNPTESGSGQIEVQEDLDPLTGEPSVFITWNGVENYPIGVTNRSTVQVIIGKVTGTVTYIYGVLDALGGSFFAGGDDALVGFSPAGRSPVVDEVDISSFGGSGQPGNLTLTLPEQLPLALRAEGGAVIGSPFDLIVDDFPVAEPVGFVGIDTLINNPPQPLSPFGGPSQSSIYLQSLALLVQVSDAAPQLTIQTPVAPAFLGVEFYAQAFWLELGQVLAGNIFGGMRTSNAMRFRIGNF